MRECRCCEGELTEKRARVKSGNKFPNVAGFARFLGVGVSCIRNIESKWPEQYSALLAIFEDEALNSDKNATILNTYVKERLNFGEKKEGGATLPVGDFQLVFEHDISEDGG